MGSNPLRRSICSSLAQSKERAAPAPRALQPLQMETLLKRSEHTSSSIHSSMGQPIMPSAYPARIMIAQEPRLYRDQYDCLIYRRRIGLAPLSSMTLSTTVLETTVATPLSTSDGRRRDAVIR